MGLKSLFMSLVVLSLPAHAFNNFAIWGFGVGIAALNDDFTSSGTLSDWTVRSVHESESADGTASISGGQMQLLPNANEYFFGSSRGLSLFKKIPSNKWGNFIIETKAYAYERGTTDVPPANYHSAGLIVYPDLSDMTDWVMVNVGRQVSTAGFEDKNTVSNSSSLVTYGTGGVHIAKMRLCYVGTSIRVLTRLDGDGSWTVRRTFTHSKGSEIGAGLVMNDYGGGAADMEGNFDYVHYKSIGNLSQCDMDF